MSTHSLREKWQQRVQSWRDSGLSQSKCLFWENTGFVLYYKSLAEDKFHWPKQADELVTITGQQMNWLLDGYDISLMKPHKKRHYDSCF
ncbi:IS66 family insertion sequence element accessory protein TnpB [Endozoicomonas sp. GU-1]|uniref:IS66 family insertion sequence element accessory protein TnpB n=1 Tax=Endozoicomonas sp. GU-1 TaxID=3009078 RepID=UPI0022B39E6A|nr:IS66 family insertion sequence element accessory protein TnpB [Endozoicomonas sp. GU-1]WBA82861.1 IS66 family insertion sequence element accessory protein TnpB [Endozoicomonas sp. GU-1]WBA85789.1 IS66 family insertion sequence element accessory protein TnpB [Endozoicomonas sp. GU-1]